MWASAKLFCAAFTVLFVVGAHEAYKATHSISDEGYLTQTVSYYFRHPALEGASDLNSRWRPVYWCRGQKFAEYSYESGLLTVNFPSESLRPPIKSSLSDVEIISVITGMSVAEVITQIRIGQGRGFARIAAAVAGALSGYRLGQWAFSRTRPPCDGYELAKLMRKPNFAATIGRELVLDELRGRVLIIDGKETSLIFEGEIAALEKMADSLPNQGYANRSPKTGRETFGFTPSSFAGRLLGHDIRGICEDIRELVARIGTRDAKLDGRSILTVQEIDILLRWLARNPEFATLAFPKFQGAAYLDAKTNDFVMPELTDTQLRVLTIIAKCSYIGMYVVGGIVLLLIFGVGGAYLITLARSFQWKPSSKEQTD